MKRVISVILVCCIDAILAAVAPAGPVASSEKEMKEVAPLPAVSLCDWSGPYVGLHAGGEFGHSETNDFATGHRFGYGESGFNGGMQFGYNYQWQRFVIGPEFDVGYMDLQGRGDEPGFGSRVHGETDSDFYTTLRGRAGITLNCHGCWLLYATGGAIGVNYTTRFHIDPNLFDARSSDFNWGYTVGGGIERKLTPRWSMKVEYLYFSLDEQSFSSPSPNLIADFNAETTGHILRVGLNYKF
jgi:outer membrane immunogenic protein